MNDDPEIEIRDPDQAPEPGRRGSAASAPSVSTFESFDGDEDAQPGYRNLVVPLVVVPAMIVMVAVLIAVLFGLLSGSEASPRDNLDQLLNGGVNERQQAAFGLVRQMLEVQHARSEGREPEWGIDASFLDRLRTARAGVAEPEAPAEVWVPFVLSSLTAQLGDPAGVAELVELTRLDDRLDPEFTFRTNAIFILGSIGRELPEPQRALVARAMIDLVEGPDEGLGWLAAGALQNLPGPESERALEGLLGSRRVDLRLQAALSLSELGSDAGAGVLLVLVDAEPFVTERETAERDGTPARWAPQVVSASRLKVLAALQVLGRLPERARLQQLADEDDDPNVRSKALELLRSSALEESPGGAE